MTAYSFQTDCESEFSFRWKSHLVVVVVVVTVANRRRINVVAPPLSRVDNSFSFIFLFCSILLLVYSLCLAIIIRSIPASTSTERPHTNHQLQFILANKLKYIRLRTEWRRRHRAVRVYMVRHSLTRTQSKHKNYPFYCCFQLENSLAQHIRQSGRLGTTRNEKKTLKFRLHFSVG